MRRSIRGTAVSVVTVGAIGLAAACNPAPPPQSVAAGAAPAAAVPAPELPLGGRTIFPDYRVVADYGSSGGPALGVLGEGSPDQAAEAVARRAESYASFGRPVQPAMELITTVALSSPGPDGIYSSRGDLDAVARYLDAAHSHHQLLLLDFQPGRGDYLPQVERFERFLLDPSVGVALDPEWNVGPRQIPGEVIGSSPASRINAVSTYLADLVRRQNLPEKLFVIHQFKTSSLPDRADIALQPGLATVLHADGFGTQATKTSVYDALAFPVPPFHPAAKLFLTQDPDMMTPPQVMALSPQPEMITYQ